MRKLIIVASLLAMTVPAMADQKRHRDPPLPQRRPYNLLPMVVVPLAIGAGMYYYSREQYSRRPITYPEPECWDELVGYDRRGREIWNVVCH
jgi:hypothetical protein